jgi:hypothetical protein
MAGDVMYFRPERIAASDHNRRVQEADAPIHGSATTQSRSVIYADEEEKHDGDRIH